MPGLKKNLLFVGVLEDKGYTVAFTKGKPIMWPSGGDMSSALEIGVKEGNVYRLTGNPIQPQVHVVMNPCELWHRRFSHLNYRASLVCLIWSLACPLSNLYTMACVRVVLWARMLRNPTLVAVGDPKGFWI